MQKKVKKGDPQLGTRKDKAGYSMKDTGFVSCHSFSAENAVLVETTEFKPGLKMLGKPMKVSIADPPGAERQFSAMDVVWRWRSLLGSRESRRDEDVGEINNSFTLAEYFDNQRSLLDFLQLKQRPV
ncbi:hypothetical protein DUI87_11440 [Hirundo rustica rustica]|uniref:Uncharacterized protein n=1 Tax=Hirundo rustica rustica TaxID=333673 RepID=A0A3M0KFG6_HIRRU|nr:hypothetical protein DUI87_11440 [Hirundo rustica rustica]